MTEEKVNPTAETQEVTTEVSESPQAVPPEAGQATGDLKPEQQDVSGEAMIEPVAAAAPEPESRSGAEHADPSPKKRGKKGSDKKKVVKTLSVGQEVQGTVIRISEFGAFIDIGVGRDGLVHISELSGNRVNKVSDVVSEGQDVTVWIRSLDRERNRISLTMRKPASVDINTLAPEMQIKGTVTRIVPYGAFVDIDTGREALLHIREMASDYVKNPSDIVSVGQEIEARIIKIDPKTKQVDLSIREEVEPEDVEVPEEPEVLEEDEEEVLPTAMELALKEALASQGKEPHWVSKRRFARRKKEENKRREQDEILSRTLDMHRHDDD